MIRMARPHFTLWLCRIAEIIIKDSVRPVRFGLTLVALFWFAGLALPGDSLVRPVYEYMRFLNEWQWMTVWLLVATGKLWRLVDPVERYRWTLTIDVLSMIVFSSVAAAIIAARPWPFPAAAAPDLACSACSLWLMMRTWSAGEIRA